jgi:hypothetical protein
VKKQLMMLVLVFSGAVQAAMIPWHWWTDAAGSNVDAYGNTWNVYAANGNPNPQLGSGAWDKWTALSYAGGQWGGRPGYNSSETLMADGYYNAPGVTIQVGAGGTYSWQGSAAATEWNAATLTFGKIAGGTWSSLYEMQIPVYTRYDLSSYGALQNISLNVGDTLTLYVRKVGGGYVDCDMSGATLLLVPEPTALALSGLGGLVLLRRRR